MKNTLFLTLFYHHPLLKRASLSPINILFISDLHYLELRCFFLLHFSFLRRQQWFLPGGQRLQFSILATFVAAMRGRSVCNKHREWGRCADSAEAMLMRLPSAYPTAVDGWPPLPLCTGTVDRCSLEVETQAATWQESGSLRERFKGLL